MRCTSLRSAREWSQFAATANIYRSRLGDDAALTAARLLATEIENPALSTMLGDPWPAGHDDRQNRPRRHSAIRT